MSAAQKIRFEIENMISDHTIQKWIRDANDIFRLDITNIEKTSFYLVETANTNHDQLIDTGKKVFVDPLIQTLNYDDNTQKPDASYIVEITFRPGVTDNPAYSAEDAFKMIGVTAKIASGHFYTISGQVNKQDIEKLAYDMMANTLIQKIDIYTAEEFQNRNRFENIELPTVVMHDSPKVETISLDQSDDALLQISDEKCLALSLEEIHHIQDHYKTTSQRRQEKNLPDQPTDVELEIIAQSWSEHCKHKIFSADINYTDENGKTETINSLYRTYIKGATKQIEKDSGIDWLISVFEDNAGIVRLMIMLICVSKPKHITARPLWTLTAEP